MDKFRILLFLALLAALQACSDSQGQAHNSPGENVEAGREGLSQHAVDFSILHSGEYCCGSSNAINNKTVKVLNNQADYNTEAALYGYTSAVVDFSQARVLVINMGQRSSGGYHLDLLGVEQFTLEHSVVDTTYSVATVEYRIPGPDCIVTQALTAPHQFIQVNTTDDILIEEFLTMTRCE